ncbi:sulfurtransferase [Ornithinimicrobium cavernae]|uniref:sulfurtransferase n=1 Tax=Ornithinimicrobium cavernae TaxID=2666047 RepID=UPI001F48C1E0|nr:sulfurtransferase [Ornithinimicrobium cavernae]
MSDLLIDPAELAELLASDDPEERPVLLDIRWSLGTPTDEHRAEYLAGHLPGAAFVPMKGGLAGEEAPDGRGGRHPMPRLLDAQEAFREAGVTAVRPVVVYDGATSVGAARAWWLLTYYGKSQVRVLDGGYAAWLAAGLPTETGEPEIEPGDIVLTPGGRRLLDADGLEHYLDRHQVVDSRPAERFRGEQETVDPVAGHIPGAISIPALKNVDESGRFLPADDLELRFTARGIQPDKRTAIYCGSGIQACHMALAMEVAEVGVYDPAIYIGSWSDWITDPERPIATGP